MCENHPRAAAEISANDIVTVATASN